MIIAPENLYYLQVDSYTMGAHRNDLYQMHLGLGCRQVFGRLLFSLFKKSCCTKAF
jgi:hypothetical protein